MRALLAMDWLNHEDQANMRSSSQDTLHQYTQLKLQLIKLVHRVLMPHLNASNASKPDLNRLILHGLPALLQDWLLLENSVPELRTLCLRLMDAAPHVLQQLVAKYMASHEAFQEKNTSTDSYQLQCCLVNIWWLFCECQSLRC